MLDLDFYYKSPIDFEQKNYILLHYLSEVDYSFAELKLSPHLLWIEKLIKELDNFKLISTNFKSSLKKDVISFNWKNGIIYSDINSLKELDEIFEIVDYSKILLDSKIKIGYALYEKFPQLLY